MFYMIMFITYILYSVTLDSYYVGYTGLKLEDRLRRHLTNHKEFTSRAKDWVVVSQEVFETKNESIARESYIKWRKSRS